MAILREPTTWKKRPRPADEPRHSSDLTPNEQANVKKALAVLRIRFGSWAKVAAVMKSKVKTVEKAACSSGKPSAGLALRVARLAGAPMEDVLSGAWPKEGACPMCGRCDEPSTSLFQT